ncbi:hypothetical protein [Burkholderia plantarii]|uniref:hypothetical protein n=1 Tax=Burkholderia plantarii TaxID=41899 RepID=UPI0018DD8A18|nr:hypothetical protein [Burkholderia plantarii]MBI0329138.1 hypothetical protein [Burkholderia plantarii]
MAIDMLSPLGFSIPREGGAGGRARCHSADIRAVTFFVPLIVKTDRRARTRKLFANDFIEARRCGRAHPPVGGGTVTMTLSNRHSLPARREFARGVIKIDRLWSDDKRAVRMRLIRVRAARRPGARERARGRRT